MVCLVRINCLMRMGVSWSDCSHESNSPSIKFPTLPGLAAFRRWWLWAWCVIVTVNPDIHVKQKGRKSSNINPRASAVCCHCISRFCWKLESACIPSCRVHNRYTLPFSENGPEKARATVFVVHHGLKQFIVNFDLMVLELHDLVQKIRPRSVDPVVLPEIKPPNPP